MNKNQIQSLYQRVNKTRNKPSSNRYAKIHVLFHELALLRMPETEETVDNWAVARSYEASKKAKQFWKDFFGIETLTELSDGRLHEIEDFLEKKVQYEYERKFGV